MDYLALCQRTRLECGIPGTGPTAVTSQTGELERIVTWVNQAWIDIQSAHKDWGWMRTTASFTTVAGDANYTLGTGAGTVGVLAANFGMWVPESSRNYETSVGTDSEIFMSDIGYESWRNGYQYSALRDSRGRPIEIAVAPDKSLCLGPTPLAGYTVTRDYFSAPDALEANADTPGIPAQYHMIIVYRAMMSHGAFSSAPEVYQRGELEFRKLLQRLTADYLPPITWGPALA